MGSHNIFILVREMAFNILDQLVNNLKNIGLSCQQIENPDEIPECGNNIVFTVNKKWACEISEFSQDNYVFYIGDNVGFDEGNFFVFGENDLDKISHGISFVLENVKLTSEFEAEEVLFEEYLKLSIYSGKYLASVGKIFSEVLPEGDVSGNVGLQEFFKLYMNFLNISNELVLQVETGEFLKKLNLWTKTFNYVGKIQLIDGDEITETFTDRKSTEMILPFFNLERRVFLKIKKVKLEKNGIQAFFIWFIRNMVQEHLEKLQKKDQIRKRNILFEEVFSKLPIPVALFSSNGELLLHNSHFLSLEILPSDCMNLVDGEKYEKGDHVYAINRMESENNGENFTCLIFSSDNACVKEKPNVSSSELGIIASSIAHELNNPLAGMLAAIELLAIEEDWDDETMTSICEMKESVKRCSELVSIFLGFSRKGPLHTETGLLQNAFKQAVGLLRFRMIESNIRLKINVSESCGIFEMNLNTSVMAMIFYLILGEIMTVHSHTRLVVSGESNTADVISGTMLETEKTMEILFDVPIDEIEKLKDMKLLSHLLNFEKLDMILTRNKLVLAGACNL